ncbi:hypothetical protein DRP05_12680 [Archaeoglobales archaeon]|nr:MAG: hypothetical protein DRP05_12680 [Archaeoglobales archaeon]
MNFNTMNMQEKEVLEIVEVLGKTLPKLPDGRIDYSNSDIAPVITVFVKHGDEILILKRSDKVRTYKGKWNTVAGYLDEVKPIEYKVLEELREETGVEGNVISKIKFGRPYKFVDNKIKKTWIVFPVLVELKEKIDPKLDWEHTEFRWIKKEELANFDTVPNLDKSFEKVC